MRKTFLLCEYSEDESGEIKLKKLENIDGDEATAKKRALELYRLDSSKTFVLLTKLEMETSNW